MFLRLKQVSEMTGLSRSMLYAMMQGGLFPKKVNIGARAVGWLREEVEQWAAAKVAQRDAKNGKAGTEAAKRIGERP